MSTITFDTLKFTDRLKEAGVPEPQARAEAEALREVFSEALDTSLATKADMQDIKHRIDLVDARMDKLQWMMGVLIALSVANFAKQFF